MIQKLITLSIVLAMSLQIFAADVSVERASKLAKNFFYTQTNIAHKVSYEKLSVELFSVKAEFGDTAYYIFNFENVDGFVIVPDDDRIMPVLAYSDKESFTGETMPPGLAGMLNDYKEQILLIKRGITTSRIDHSTDWNRLENGSLKSTNTTLPQPLLLMDWSQGWPYNEFCPEDSNGPGGHALVGCVAISMAQVVKYYGYPSQGSGNASYYHQDYGSLSASFGATEYHFENMPLSANQMNSDMAEFLYHCGVAVEMGYGADGSGAYVGDACDALVDHFGYSGDLEYEKRSWYSDTQWRQLLKNEIDARRPMIYRGYSGQFGHAWNCDGYNGNLFHMNWGWGGSYNGYFNLDQLVPSTYDFSGGHRAGVNIYPNANYPEFCTNVVELNGNEGSFQDGSGPEDYLNNTTCIYEILPDCGQIIDVDFDMIDLASGDTIFVYNDVSSNGILVGTVHDSTTSASFSSSNGSMLLKFVSNGNTVSNGWAASYSVKNCEGTKTISSQYGSFNDGSNDCNYHNSRLCYWVINPPAADTIHLSFPSFELYPDMDNIRIYDSEILSANQLAKFDASNLPYNMTVPSGKVIVQFFTNSSENSGGWTINYDSYIDPLTVSEESDYEFSVYPNPVKDQIFCSYSGQANEIQLVSSMGSVIALQTDLNSEPASFDVSHLAAGIYFIRLIAEDRVETQRFVKK